MFKLAISIDKGGVGKTMLTKTIATAATKAGLNVVILDVDNQMNATQWRRRRDAKQKSALPIVRYSTEKDLLLEIENAENAGCDLLLIDTPPGKSTEALAAVEISDLVLIPFENDQDSYEGVATTAVMARRLGTEAIGVLNKAQPNSTSHEATAKEVLKAIGISMSPVVLHRYDVHRLANPKGLTAQELDPESVAAVEIKSLWAWISATLQIGNRAIVHKKGAA